MFQENRFSDNWVEDVKIFVDWLYREQKRCIPTGYCGQSMSITTGLGGLISKYPTFEDAYKAYKLEMDSIET